MRNMSFSMTMEQLLDGSKTVTRRMKWLFLKAGDQVRAIEKGQGLKKGEKVKPLGVCTIVDVRREWLRDITVEDVAREGFPEQTPQWFCEMFIKATGKRALDKSGYYVTRIEFTFEPNGEIC